MLITCRTIFLPHIISIGTDSSVHTVFIFANILGICIKATFHQINYLAAFA